jgi:tetratricopeptide (TPR) repeat protein
MDTAGLLQLAKANHESGRVADAARLYREVLRLTPFGPQQAHPWYLLGAVYQAQGERPAAMECFRESIRLRPEFAHAHYHLGITLAEQFRFPEAEECLFHALALKPDFPDCFTRLGEVLATQGKTEHAESMYRQAALLQPSAARFLTLASMLFRENKVNEAFEAFARAAESEPGSAEVHTSWGTALISLGQTDEAIARLHQAIRLQPDHAPAYGFLGELTREGSYAFSPAELDTLNALLANPQTPSEKQAILHFALGDVAERLGDHVEAFTHYRRANELQHWRNVETGTACNIAAHRKLVDDLIAGFTPEFFRRVTGFGSPSETPLFIVGMPRSGTTLVDRIIAAQPQAASGGELADMEKIVVDLPRLMDRGRTLDLLAQLDRTTMQMQADRYLRRLEQLGPGALRVTDKMPQNYFYAGFIAALFPHARIIHCRRDPLDTCVSCYTHNFADFSTSLETLSWYYREYERLMAHWRLVLPLPMHEVQYETLVAQPDAVIRDLIAFCRLPWDERCLTFHENRGPVHTVSRMQVRRPLYASSVGGWRKYAPFLDPLRTALSACLRSGVRESP